MDETNITTIREWDDFFTRMSSGTLTPRQLRGGKRAAKCWNGNPCGIIANGECPIGFYEEGLDRDEVLEIHFGIKTERENLLVDLFEEGLAFHIAVSEHDWDTAREIHERVRHGRFAHYL